MVEGVSVHLDTGGLMDNGASAIAENLSQWTPRKGDGGEGPPTPTIFGSIAARNNAALRATFIMHRLGLDIEKAKLLETGCGYGDGLRPFLFSGFMPHNMTGIDLMPERLDIARQRISGATFVHGNGASLPFQTGSFDVVCEQHCFCHIPDDDIKREIAAEMVRVARPGGFVIVNDWRIAMKSRNIYGPSQRAIAQMFSVGSATRRLVSLPSMLWPPLGNRVSRISVSAYLALTAIPALVGTRLTVLQKL